MSAAAKPTAAPTKDVITTAKAGAAVDTKDVKTAAAPVKAAEATPAYDNYGDYGGAEDDDYDSSDDYSDGHTPFNNDFAWIVKSDYSETELYDVLRSVAGKGDDHAVASMRNFYKDDKPTDRWMVFMKSHIVEKLNVTEDQEVTDAIKSHIVPYRFNDWDFADPQKGEQDDTLFIPIPDSISLKMARQTINKIGRAHV